MYYKLIENAFSDDYIDNLLVDLSGQTFQKAQVDVYGEKQSLEHIRNNMRLELTNTKLAQDIDKIISKEKDFPLSFHGLKYQYPSIHFRSYLYEPGQYFKPHRDGASQEDKYKSKITCLLYLNNTDGGETILMPDGYSVKDSQIKVVPKKGLILLFEHKLWHEGTPVLSGNKIVLRNNLMYSTD